MKRNALHCIILLLIVLFSFSACDGIFPHSSSNDVQVQETDFHISSSVTSFKVKQLYHFIVKNNGKASHEFMLMPKKGDDAAIGNASMNHNQMLSLASIANINPGDTKTVDYTFLESAKGSQPQFACYYEGHYEAGMWLDLTVN